MIMGRQCVMSSTLSRASYIDSRSFLANGVNRRHAFFFLNLYTFECANERSLETNILTWPLSGAVSHKPSG